MCYIAFGGTFALRLHGFGFGCGLRYEFMYVLSESPLQMPEQNRLHHPGSSHGDTIYGVAKTTVEQEMHVLWGLKKKALGKRLKLAWGKTPDTEGTESVAPHRADTRVPMSHHTAPEKLLHEVVCHNFNI